MTGRVNPVRNLWCGFDLQPFRKIISNGANLKLWLAMTVIWLCLSGITIAVERHVPSQYSTIQAAIDAAVDGDTVIVAPGTYTGDGNRDIDFLGKAITVRSIDPNDPNIVAATIIDCQGTEAEPHCGFYFHHNEGREGAQSILNGFTITKGYGSNSGGAINCYNSNPTIQNCVIIGNEAKYCGGGMITNYGAPTLINCTFSNNSAPDRGGAIWCHSGGSPRLMNCKFIGNRACNGAGVSECHRSLITDCVFMDNTATGSGGAIYIVDGSPRLEKCVFVRNSANGGGGGGIYVHSTTDNATANPTITSCIFVGNTALVGGGMYNISGTGSARTMPSIVNCTITCNSAAFGGGMYNEQGISLSITLVKVANSILWNNEGNEIVDEKTTTDVSYSCIESGWPGEGNIDADPLFVNPDINDFHLLPDSPCINAGDPDYVAEPDETDIDGELRVMLGRVDMGADEFSPFEIDFIVVNKRRIGRTIFEYDCNAYLHNISLFNVKNIQLEIVKTPENMKIIEPNVTFGDAVVRAGESATSVDTCTFEVDRAQAIEPMEIIWWSSCELVAAGQQMQHSGSSLVFLEQDNITGDLTGESRVDFADLAKLAEQWLQPPGKPSADIAPTGGDGIINFLDFAELAENWRL